MKLQPLTEEINRPKRIGIAGESGTGKTHKLLELMVWALSKVESPEQLKFAFIDCDDGLRPLIKRGLLPEELRSRIMYNLYYQDWNGIRDDTKEILPELEKNAKENGPDSTWFIVDNGAKVWDWLHDDYCRDVFGKTRKEMMRDARKRAIEAGKGAMPVLNQMLDYGVLNAEFFGWWDQLQFSNINVVVTSPVWATREKDDSGKTVITEVNMKGVNPELVHRLDELFWTHKPNNAMDADAYLSSLIKTRNTSKKFSNVEGLTFNHWMKWCSKHQLEEPLVIPQ